jgi:predicted MFS family arabinose efflux permease
MTRILSITAFICFTTALFVRSVDPLIPQIAADIGAEPAKVALLGAAFALPYAIIQPILGPFGDFMSKTRLMTGCLLIAVLAAVVGALATDFTTLLVARVIGGIASGGVFPVSLALVGDVVPVQRRQVAIGYLLAAAITGNLLGASLAGVIGDLVGWRAVFWVIAAITLGAFAAALAGFGTQPPRRTGGFSLAIIPASYRSIFANPRAKVCYLAVLTEGVVLFGVFPYIALLLHAAGETRASIAGLIIAGFGLGGIVFSLAAGPLLARSGERQLMYAGGTFAALGLVAFAFAAWWPLALLATVLMGFGFYMLHSTIQVHVTELTQTARSAATALHSAFFFGGQAIGPVVYGFALPRLGVVASLSAAAAVMLLVGVAAARLLPHRKA